MSILDLPVVPGSFMSEVLFGGVHEHWTEIPPCLACDGPCLEPHTRCASFGGDDEIYSLCGERCLERVMVAVDRDTSRAQWVYFMRPAGLAGPIKIGWSTDPARRARVIGKHQGFPLDVLGRVHGARHLESVLHRHFAADRLGGEWFAPSDTLLETVGTLPFSAYALMEPAA